MERTKVCAVWVFTSVQEFIDGRFGLPWGCPRIARLDPSSAQWGDLSHLIMPGATCLRRQRWLLSRCGLIAPGLDLNTWGAGIAADTGGMTRI